MINALFYLGIALYFILILLPYLGVTLEAQVQRALTIIACVLVAFSSLVILLGNYTHV